MKKIFTLMLALALALGLSASALAYSDKNLEAPKAKDVIIDGDLSEWDTSKSLKIDSLNQIIDQIEHWDGEADCSMEAYAMWDEDNLYIAMKILDDTPLVYREGFPLDELDAVIFFLSTDPTADPERTEYTATDWRIVQSAYGYKGEYANPLAVYPDDARLTIPEAKRIAAEAVSSVEDRLPAEKLDDLTCLWEFDYCRDLGWWWTYDGTWIITWFDGNAIVSRAFLRDADGKPTIVFIYLDDHDPYSDDGVTVYTDF